MSDLTWKTIDPNTLPEKHKALHVAYKAAYAKASEARKAFEAAMNTDAKLPEGKSLAFSYRFGQLGIAIADTASKKASAKVMSLADYLEAAKVA